MRSYLAILLPEMNVNEKNIPFIPVIPLGDMGIHGLMAMIQHKSRKGSTRIHGSQIFDLMVPEMEKPYFIFDIEDGASTVNRKISKAMQDIRSKRTRKMLTLQDAIALVVHTDVISKHPVVVAQSVVKGGNAVGILVKNGCPIAEEISDQDETGWGIPTYLERGIFI